MQKRSKNGNISYELEDPADQRDGLITAGAIIKNKEGKILTIFHNKFNQISVPGGKADGTEDPKDTIIRECLEEVNVKVLHAELLFKYDYTYNINGKDLNWHHYVYEIYWDRDEEQINNNEPEKHSWIEFKEEQDLQILLKLNPYIVSTFVSKYLAHMAKERRGF